MAVRAMTFLEKIENLEKYLKKNATLSANTTPTRNSKHRVVLYK